MKRPTLKKILIGIFLIGSLACLALFNATKPRILVLHSFSADDVWTQRVNAGIQRALQANRNPVSVNMHYLDILAQTSQDRLEVAIHEAQRAIARQNPHLVIAVDDEVNELVAASFVGRDHPKVLYMSILQPPSWYGYDKAGNVSGVLEVLPLPALQETFLTLRSGTPSRIAVLAMDDPTGRAEMKQVQQHHWAPHQVVAALSSNQFDEWRRFIADQANQADALLVLSYEGLRNSANDPTVVPEKAVADWIETRSQALPISISPHYAHDGGGLSISPSPSDIGMQGMQMGLSWIESKKGSPAPQPGQSEHFNVGIRQSRLDARGVILPKIYIEAARLGDAYFPQ